jgi:hypothetical protein
MHNSRSISYKNITKKYYIHRIFTYLKRVAIVQQLSPPKLVLKYLPFQAPLDASNYIFCAYTFHVPKNKVPAGAREFADITLQMTNQRGKRTS